MLNLRAPTCVVLLYYLKGDSVNFIMGSNSPKILSKKCDVKYEIRILPTWPML
jgi:hypothetical protein